MKKFLVIYMAPVGAFDEMMKNPDPAKMKEMSDSWTSWMKAHEKSFTDQGAPTGKNKRVAKGSVKDVRNEVTGYSVVQAESHDEATKIFKDNPMLQTPGAYIEVLEWMEMAGM